MLVTSVFMAVTGLLWGWMTRKIMVDGVSYKLRPDPQVRFGASSLFAALHVL
jgi:hypothetical protein